MPMARFQAKVAGHEGQIFAHLPFNPEKEGDRLAADGVSCSLCHQITTDKLGTGESFVGGFVVDTTKPKGERAEYGPYKVDAGHARIMRSSSGGFQPTESEHIGLSEVCATCHTRPGSAGKGCRRAAGANAVSGVAAQRLQGPAELPVLPYARC
jgi:mono/diheme cytochrome c family protein